MAGLKTVADFVPLRSTSKLLRNDEFPEDLTLEVGMQIAASQPDGDPIQFTVKEIGEQNVTLDGNHFLAGKDLIFSVTLVSIT